MKILLDACVWGPATAQVAAAGHDVAWVGDWPEDPGDDRILEIANAEQRILVTLDKEFGELAIVHGRPHSGIMRLNGFPARAQASVCVHILKTHGEKLLAGAVVTAEPGRIRIRLSDDASRG